MIRNLLAATGVIALVGIAAPQPHQGGKNNAKSTRIAAERHDVSRPLREIVPIKPAPHHKPSDREKKFARQILRPRTADPIVQNYASAALIPAPGMSFEGVGNVNGVLPPDTNADVGPNHYVQSVNVSFAVYSKGTDTTPPALLYGPAAMNTLWTGFGGPCEARNDGDGIVMYDHLADRWVISQLALPNLIFGLVIGPFYQCIAVSATPDPTGAYHRYQFSFKKLNDYPKLGVWPDAYFMAINQFTSVSLQYAGQGVIAFDRQKMLAGLPATMQYVDLAPVDINLGGMLPADLDGPAPPPGSPGYFVQVDDDTWGYAPSDRLQLWRFSVDWANPAATTFTGPFAMPVAPFDSDLCAYSRNCIPQGGTPAKVDAMADRLMYRLQYRNFGSHESLVVNHTVDADGTDHAGLRWYEVRDPRNAPFVHQQGTYAPDFDHRWMGSVAMDASGNMALGFSVSGVSLAPSIRYTGRLADDPPGAMTLGEADIITGGGGQNHTSGRWGDYSMMAVDPVDGCTFWYTQQYYGATSEMGWQTRVGRFSFPSCASSSSLPRVTITASTPTAAEAGLVNGVFTVSRTGETTEPLTVSYLVSGTATPEGDYVTLPGTVTIPSGAASQEIAVTPVDDPFSEPNETVTVTLNLNPTYTPGSPSQALVTIVSEDLPPDLIVAALTVPATGVPGSPVVVNDTTKNQSTGTAAPTSTAFYLSTNVLLDAADPLLGTRAVPALQPGASSVAQTTFTIPPTTVTGTYYVIAKADSAGAIAETNESNNSKFSGAMRIGPDFDMDSFTVPAGAGEGATVSVTDTTKNIGSVSAPASRTAIYFSANAILDAGDTLLGSRAVAAIPAGGTNAGSTSVQIPEDTATGTWFLFAKADANEEVAETSETNNASFATAIKIGPDLTMSGLTAPATAAAGTTISVTETTRNTGGGNAAASTTRFYLSTNFTFDASDELVGSRDVPALIGGATNIRTTSITIPAGKAPATYYLLAVADGTEVIVETSETNNTVSRAIRVLAGSIP